jgi:molybdopterin-guanine dinucleotide biosynthesis protein A
MTTAAAVCTKTRQNSAVKLFLTGERRQRYSMAMERKETDVTGVILVGGKSRRMGTDKAFLRIGGTPLFERVLSVFRETFARTILVGNQAERFAGYGLDICTDLYPGSALGGLYTGLVRGGTPHVFVSACDVPFPSSAVVRYLVALREGYDAVVPQVPDGFEPLFALYAASCREPMQAFLERGNYCISDLYPGLHVRYVPLAELARFDGVGRTFININTPAEFTRARRGKNR